MSDRKILVVDDNLDAAELMTRLLEFYGFQAACVASGEAALEFIHRAQPALMILDAMMPGMDGMEVLRQVRADPQTAAMPVVMYTGVSDPAYREHALSRGANDYWVKSKLNLDEIKTRVERLLQKSDLPA